MQYYDRAPKQFPSGNIQGCEWRVFIDFSSTIRTIDHSVLGTTLPAIDVKLIYFTLS
ncbi:hypothetical protein M595_0877 [Lyngbya aestuarii BL J]|uniref:Uncharacterized protein n=1 Tax=Lyngbya aestuarii BL J TaxID=1348334 RepID=U7QPS5_9CYAN|nr:hypothetical protein M595_0877 [Lyngbya aestuarii BL J]